MKWTALALSFLLVACAPLQHTVKPLPNFVKVGLQVGDSVTVVTHGGEEHEFVITEIREDALLDGERQFMLKNLASIKKHAWSRPESPCGGEKPLGCSIPLLVALASESHSHYQSKFYDACAQHDYCYRHGAATYGTTRENCDNEFRLDMKNLCPDPAVSQLGKVFEVIDGSLDSRSTCLSVADDYYHAVRRYGEERFLSSNATYCEYNGPPAFPISARPVSPPGHSGQ